MALKITKPESLTMSKEVDVYFNLPMDDNILAPTEDYEDLKEQIYDLDIDYEEKANMINKIGSLKTKNDFEKHKIKKEIEEFKKLHNLV